MVNFETSVSIEHMEKKDILIFTAVLLLVGLNLYRRYAKKKGVAGAETRNKKGTGSSLSSQPDDYEPYSGEKLSG